MRAFLQAAFAVAVILGWFLVSLWMVVSVVQIGLVQRSSACFVDATLEVTCGSHP